MRRVLLDRARAGDELAEPVQNDRGVVILPKGARLSIALIDRLRKMGVAELAVTRDDPAAPPPKTPEELRADLDARFAGLEGNPLMMAIKEVARRHLEERRK